MSFFENTRKPVGFAGKLMVAMMNLGHSPVARWGLRFLNVAPDARVLDCGCGGGANIRRLFLRKRGEGSKAQPICNSGGALCRPARQRGGYDVCG